MSSAPRTTKVVPNTFADISQFFTLDGDPEPMAITYGINVGDPPFTAGQLAECRLAYVTNLTPFMPPFYKVGNIRASVAQAVGDPAIIEVVASTAGTDTVVPHIPQNSALLVSKGTALGGRRNRGRFYVPGLLNEGVVDNVGNVSASTYQPLFTAFLEDLLVEANTNVLEMVLFHSYEWTGDVDPGPPPGFPAPTVVTALTVNGRIATQRRRLRR